MNVTEEQVFEHERFMPLAGWNSRHLLPTERNRYSRQEDGMNSTAQFPQMRLPEGEHLARNTDTSSLKLVSLAAGGLSNYCTSVEVLRVSLCSSIPV